MPNRQYSYKSSYENIVHSLTTTELHSEEAGSCLGAILKNQHFHNRTKLLLRFRIELEHAWFERVSFSCETYASLCGNCHVSKGKLLVWSMVIRLFIIWVQRFTSEEVGQLSREFLDQSNRTIFYASWLRFLSRKFTQDGKNL